MELKRRRHGQNVPFVSSPSPPRRPDEIFSDQNLGSGPTGPRDAVPLPGIRTLLGRSFSADPTDRLTGWAEPGTFNPPTGGAFASAGQSM